MSEFTRLYPNESEKVHFTCTRIRYCMVFASVRVDNPRALVVLSPTKTHKPFAISGIYRQRQKLSTTNFVAKFFRAGLCDVNRPYR